MDDRAIDRAIHLLRSAKHPDEPRQRTNHKIDKYAE